MKKQRDIKAVVPVHFGGLAFDAKKIYNISKKNLKIVEDAAYAFEQKDECGAMVGSSIPSNCFFISSCKNLEAVEVENYYNK